MSSEEESAEQRELRALRERYERAVAEEQAPDLLEICQGRLDHYRRCERAARLWPLRSAREWLELASAESPEQPVRWCIGFHARPMPSAGEVGGAIVLGSERGHLWWREREGFGWVEAERVVVRDGRQRLAQADADMLATKCARAFTRAYEDAPDQVYDGCIVQLLVRDAASELREVSTNIGNDRKDPWVALARGALLLQERMSATLSARRAQSRRRSP